jgi:hypothetical protein
MGLARRIGHIRRYVLSALSGETRSNKRPKLGLSGAGWNCRDCLADKPAQPFRCTFQSRVERDARVTRGAAVDFILFCRHSWRLTAAGVPGRRSSRGASGLVGDRFHFHVHLDLINISGPRGARQDWRSESKSGNDPGGNPDRLRSIAGQGPSALCALAYLTPRLRDRGGRP